MPSKKSKLPEKNSSNKETAKEDKYVLLRDLSNQMLLIVDYNQVSTSKASKITVGCNVMYVTTDRNRGRGTILHIGSEKDCTGLLMVLEKGNTTKNNDNSRSTLIIDEREEQSNDESEVEESGSTTNKEQGDVTVTSQISSSNINVKNVSNKSPAKNNKRPLSLTKKSSNESDEKSPTTKRLKNNDDDSYDKYLRSRIELLQKEKDDLENQIEAMKTTWMPRPDPVTLDYFAKIVSICVDGDKYEEESKGDKLAKIIAFLGLTQKDCDKCTDPKSIRSTCRKLVRVVFKTQLAEPKIHFGDLLKKEETNKRIAAIREYARIMHPVESLKFTNGELNNSMGSDFYQRDRNIKQRKDDTSDHPGDNVDDNIGDDVDDEDSN